MNSDALPETIVRDVAAIQRIAAVPSMLEIVRRTTGMEVVAIARVTSDRWVACAVLDDTSFHLQSAGELPVEATICSEVVRGTVPIAVEDCREDATFRDHPFFRRHPFRSYVAEPIVLASGECFGTLCAMGSRPAKVKDPTVLMLLRHFADQVAAEIDGVRKTEGILRELGAERAGGAQREEFIAILGHDLRNPLSSISSAAQVLKLQNPGSSVASLSDRILANVRRMAGLVEDLLDLARGRLGDGMALETSRIDDLDRAIEDVVDEIRSANAGRRITSSFSLQAPVVADRARLQQLVSNLVGNAVTHGAAEGTISIVVRADGEQLEIGVHNEGTPIPAESMPGLFDAYARLQEAGKRPTGLGLGLYICDQIVAAHGGVLRAESSADGGTLFVATIPSSLRRSRPSRT